MTSDDHIWWAEHPRPWRVEVDWTAEIIDARGRIVEKLPLQRLWLAQLIVRLVNAMPSPV